MSKRRESARKTRDSSSAQSSSRYDNLSNGYLIRLLFYATGIEAAATPPKNSANDSKRELQHELKKASRAACFVDAAENVLNALNADKGLRPFARQILYLSFVEGKEVEEICEELKPMPIRGVTADKKPSFVEDVRSTAEHIVKGQWRSTLRPALLKALDHH